MNLRAAMFRNHVQVQVRARQLVTAVAAAVAHFNAADDEDGPLPKQPERQPSQPRDAHSPRRQRQFTGVFSLGVACACACAAAFD